MTAAPVPIVVFAYRRPDELYRLLTDVRSRPECAASPVYVFSDGARGEKDAADVTGVRRVLDGFSAESRLVRCDAPANKGLARSVIEGVTEVFRSHSRAIVLEDDLELAPGFFDFLFDALDRYESNRRVFSACGYRPPVPLPPGPDDGVYFVPRIGSLGWATWRDRWTACDWSLSTYARFARDRAALRRFSRGGQDLPHMLDAAWSGRVDSWAIVFSYEAFRADALSLFPRRSLVRHLELPETSTHVFSSAQTGTELDARRGPWRFPAEVEADPAVLDAYACHYRIRRRDRWLLEARALSSRVLPWLGPGPDRRKWR